MKNIPFIILWEDLFNQKLIVRKTLQYKHLQGELLSYSERTLELYLKHIDEMLGENINLAIENMNNIARMQGFKNSEEVENFYNNYKSQ